jgi:hypothetical protein
MVPCSTKCVVAPYWFDSAKAGAKQQNGAILRRQKSVETDLRERLHDRLPS